MILFQPSLSIASASPIPLAIIYSLTYCLQVRPWPFQSLAPSYFHSQQPSSILDNRNIPLASGSWAQNIYSITNWYIPCKKIVNPNSTTICLSFLFQSLVNLHVTLKCNKIFPSYFFSASPSNNMLQLTYHLLSLHYEKKYC